MSILMTEQTVVANHVTLRCRAKSVADPMPEVPQLEVVPFGQYLVERGAITRDQLYRAMRLQDSNPGVRIGECVARLGVLPWREVDRLYIDYSSCATYFG